MMQKEERKKDSKAIGMKQDVFKSERKKIMDSIRMEVSRKMKTKMEFREKRVTNLGKETRKKEKATARRRTPTMSRFCGRGF